MLHALCSQEIFIKFNFMQLDNRPSRKYHSLVLVAFIQRKETEFMKIKNVLFAQGVGGFFFDDQAAIRSGLDHNGFIYQGAPCTSGFDRVRIPAESVSVMLVLENGETALGDCCAVQYSGAAGRDPLFIAERYIPLMAKHLTPELLGRESSDFKENAEFLDTLKSWDGKQLPTAIRYGLSQEIGRAHV